MSNEQPTLNKGIAQQCKPKLFTIHYSLLTNSLEFLQ